MSLKKISQLPTMSQGDVDPNTDIVPIVDVTTGETKHVLLSYIQTSGSGASGSFVTTTDFNNYTSSTDADLNSLTIFTSSIQGEVDSLTSFTGSYNTGSFTGSFVGDGSGLTGVISEWDGTLNGNAEITGSATISGSLITLGGKVRRTRTITITDSDVGSTTGAEPTYSIEEDDDLLIVIDNTVSAKGVNDYSLSCSSFITSPVGQTVEIVLITLGTGLIIGGQTMSGYNLNGVSNDLKVICNVAYESVTLVNLGSNELICYGTGV